MGTQNKGIARFSWATQLLGICLLHIKATHLHHSSTYCSWASSPPPPVLPLWAMSKPNWHYPIIHLHNWWPNPWGRKVHLHLWQPSIMYVVTETLICISRAFPLCSGSSYLGSCDRITCIRQICRHQGKCVSFQHHVHSFGAKPCNEPQPLLDPRPTTLVGTGQVTWSWS